MTERQFWDGLLSCGHDWNYISAGEMREKEAQKARFVKSGLPAFFG